MSLPHNVSYWLPLLPHTVSVQLEMSRDHKSLSVQAARVVRAELSLTNWCHVHENSIGKKIVKHISSIINVFSIVKKRGNVIPLLRIHCEVQIVNYAHWQFHDDIIQRLLADFRTANKKRGTANSNFSETAMQNAQRAQSKIKGKKLEGAFLFYYYHNIILLYVTCKLKWV